MKESRTQGKLDIRKADWIIFGVLWCAYTAVMLLLFHRQTVNYGGGYESDMKSYVLYIQGIDTGNTYAYPVMFWLAKLFALALEPRLAVTLAVTVMNSLTPLALKLCGDRLLEREMEDYGKKRLLFDLIIFASLFLSMLFWPGAVVKVDYRYKGVFSPNPFHNATYLAARGFAVVSFFLFIELLDSFRKENAWKENKFKYVLFGASLLLATMTKPSFTLGFIAACGILLVVWWIKDGLSAWKSYVRIGICFIPTFLDLLYQYRGVFTGVDNLGLEQGIGIGWLAAWSTATDCVPAAILLGLAFPLTVLLCNGRELKKNIAYRFSWELLLVNLLMLTCLYEKGWRMWHMNFAWGYMYGMFFAYLMSLLLLFINTVQKKQTRWVIAIQWCAFGLHLLCGILYFASIMSGESYV